MGLFSKEQQEQVKAAIIAAEKRTSGEIRICVEDTCKAENVLDRAVYHFEKLEMHKTDLRNGVLIYLAVKSHQLAIIGDAGINKVTGHDFWDHVKDAMLIHFKKGDYTDGLIEGIHMAGEALGKHFPSIDGDINELGDDMIISENTH